jgi:PAS domain S-box-containing protein
MAASTALTSVFDVEAFIHEYYDAWSGTDEDLILSYYAEHVVLHIPGLLMEGKEAVRDQFARPFIAAFPGNRHVVKNMIFGPGMVVVEFSFEAQHKGPFAGHAATGARVTLPGCGVYEYDSAKRQIIAGRIFFDVGTLLQTITDALVGDRKQAEQVLRTNERNLSLITNVIPTFIHVLRTDGSVLYVNQAVLGYTGLTLEDVRREDYRARAFHPEDVERLREERREALVRPVPFENEQRLLGKDGRYRWFLIRYNPLLDEQGGIDRWYVAAFDIEDRKRAEAQVEQAYLHLAEAQRLSKTGSFITDLSVDDHNWSEEAFRIFEFDPATKLTLQMIRGMVHSEDLPSFDAVIARGMTGTDVDFVFRIVMSRGAVKHVRGIARITEQIAGRPLFIGALQDVTESKVAEEALNRARSELAHMARVTTLSALTASIAHEVNQPLAAIVADGTASLNWLAAAPPDLDRVRDALDAIVTDGHRAAEVIQRIRQLATKSAPRKDRLDVNGVVGDVEPLVRAELGRHEVELTLDLARGLPPVIGDRVQLQQVLLNLVMNGMEAMAAVTDRPRELLIRSRPHEEDQILVAVQDMGVGIDPNDLDQLFNAFFTTKPGGMGIGLSICRSIVDAHGGRLWATPNAGYGATFHFALPGIWVAGSTSHAGPKSARRGPRPDHAR